MNSKMQKKSKKEKQAKTLFNKKECIKGKYKGNVTSNK